MNKNSQKIITVIMPFFNAVNYIAEAIDSIINQTIGLDKVDLILINDNSDDNYMDVLDPYLKRYNQSIKLIHNKDKNNRGPGIARNLGIKEVKTPYVAFLDSDDYLDSNVLKYTSNILDKDDELDVVIYEYRFFSDSNKNYPRNPSEVLFSLNKTLEHYEILQYPEIIHSTSTCNNVYRASLFNKIGPFPNGHFEDITFSFDVHTTARKLHITDKVTYFYRKREENTNTSIMDSIYTKKDNFNYHLLANEKLNIIAKKNLGYKYMIDWFNVRTWVSFLRALSLNKSQFEKDYVEDLFLRTKELWKDVDVNNIYDNGISSVTKRIVKIVQNCDSMEAFDKKFQYKRLINIKYISIRILQKIIVRLKWLYQIIIIRILKIIRRSLKWLFVRFEILNLKQDSFYKELPDNIWLFSERGNEANDNAYHLFKYIRENYPEIPVYYLINKENEIDFRKIEKLGNQIDYGSKHHKIAYLKASILLSSLLPAQINLWPIYIYKKLKKYLHQKYVFLQHGIIYNDLSQQLQKKNFNIDIFITGAKPEYDYITKYFGYDGGEVKYTGLARFDALHNVKPKKMILCMPTWRADVCQPSWIKERRINDSAFLQSEYYKRYQNLINSKELVSFLEQVGYEFIFYPHYEVQQYLKYFSSNSKHVVIASKEDYDVQTLLKDAKLLITDFSSVFFDFAYMKKPSVFYQFDEENFHGKHYKKGYFDYRRHGFGEVCKDEGLVLEAIKRSYDNEFELEDTYLNRLEKFFPKNDTRNCERIYDEICKL